VNAKHGRVGATDGDCVGDDAEGATDGKFVGCAVTGASVGIADGAILGTLVGMDVTGSFVGVSVTGDFDGAAVGLPEALHATTHALSRVAKFESTMLQSLILSKPFSKYSETKMEAPLWFWNTQRISLKMNPVSKVKPLSPTN